MDVALAGSHVVGAFEEWYRELTADGDRRPLTLRTEAFEYDDARGAEDEV